MAPTTQATMQPRSGKRSRRIVPLGLAKEIRYIRRRAAARNGRIVSIGELVLFSTETGDAWVLDPGDHFAARVARDGVPERIAFVENNTSFAISWPGDYRVEGPDFVYSDRQTGRVTTILGYPTHAFNQIGEFCMPGWWRTVGSTTGFVPNTQTQPRPIHVVR